MSDATDKEGLIEVFCAYIIRNGKIIYPKGARCFHFWMRPKKTTKSEAKSG